MLITRTPLRISIGGGGTDLPSYYRSAAAPDRRRDRQVRLPLAQPDVHRRLLPEVLRARAGRERLDDIRHPILREALSRHDVGPGVEIV